MANILPNDNFILLWFHPAKTSQFCILSHHTLKTLSPFKSTLSDEWDQTAAVSQAEGYTIIASMNRGCWHTRLHWSEWLGPCVHPTLWDLCCVSVLCFTFCQRFAVHPEIKGWRDKKRGRNSSLVLTDWTGDILQFLLREINPMKRRQEIMSKHVFKCFWTSFPWL